MPYQIVNGLEFYQRKEIKDVLAYLHLVNNPRNDVALAADHQHADPRHRQGDDRADSDVCPPARGCRCSRRPAGPG